jgi:hypothetical protein
VLKPDSLAIQFFILVTLTEMCLKKLFSQKNPDMNICNEINLISYLEENIRPCHSSGGYSLASQSGGPGSSPSQVMWDLWWTK